MCKNLVSNLRHVYSTHRKTYHQKLKHISQNTHKNLVSNLRHDTQHSQKDIPPKTQTYISEYTQKSRQ